MNTRVQSAWTKKEIAMQSHSQSKKLRIAVVIALTVMVISTQARSWGQSFGRQSAPQNGAMSPKVREQAVPPNARHAARISENGIQSRESMAELTQPSASLFSRAVNYDSGGIVAYSVTVADVNGDG